MKSNQPMETLVTPSYTNLSATGCSFGWPDYWELVTSSHLGPTTVHPCPCICVTVTAASLAIRRIHGHRRSPEQYPITARPGRPVLHAVARCRWRVRVNDFPGGRCSTIGGCRSCCLQSVRLALLFDHVTV